MAFYDFCVFHLYWKTKTTGMKHSYNMCHPFITARKRSLGQFNIFSSVCQEFCPWGGLSQCMLGYDTPLEQTPPRAGTPRSRHPPGRRHPPLRSACWEIRSTSERYASYWNAILFVFFNLLSFFFFEYVTKSYLYKLPGNAKISSKTII